MKRQFFLSAALRQSDAHFTIRVCVRLLKERWAAAAANQMNGWRGGPRRTDADDGRPESAAKVPKIPAGGK